MFNLLFKYPLMNGHVNSGGAGTAEKGKATVNHAQVDKTDVKVDGNGNVGLGFNSNHILQFPRQPKRDDGKWIALGSLLGALVGKLASGGIMKQVKAAESKWKDVNDSLFNKGRDVWDKAPEEWGKKIALENGLNDGIDWDKNQRDNEINYGYALNGCNDEIHNLLCEYVKCGYKPDYYGISTRAIASAETTAHKELQEIRKTLNRYSVHQCCDMAIKVSTAKVMAVVGAVSTQREEERRKQWDVNNELRFKAAEMFEKHRQGRVNQALLFDKEHSSNAQWLYDKHNQNFYKLTELGGDFLAAAGKNYGWLADSLRKSAEKDAAGLSSLGAMIALIAGMWFCGDMGNMCKDDACGG